MLRNSIYYKTPWNDRYESNSILLLEFMMFRRKVALRAFDQAWPKGMPFPPAIPGFGTVIGRTSARLLVQNASSQLLDAIFANATVYSSDDDSGGSNTEGKDGGTETGEEGGSTEGGGEGTEGEGGGGGGGDGKTTWWDPSDPDNPWWMQGAQEAVVIIVTVGIGLAILTPGFREPESGEEKGSSIGPTVLH